MPNRAAELAWDEPPGTSGDGLTRARIVEAALAIADAEGLDAVSIRRVAAELQARPMSLYSHIASKEDLVALMLNEVSGRGLVREPLSQDWRQAMSQIARAAYSVYLDHPWALSAFGTAPRAGPNLLR
ncbi:MAG TPA: TetR/AcrR family transcriptional regulator, partial [Thermoleophilaceae bacterium]|nr:TetR/AcrR family transcriptional regulator [Thermoleophilaceae bacterium]